MAVELVDRLIEDGIEEVQEVYEEGGPKLTGAIEGFELARKLPATYEDFDWVVNQREAAEREMSRAMGAFPTEEALDEYKRHRWGTHQLEYIRNILLVAKAANGGLPPGTAMSARAIIKYASIVGTRPE